MFLKQSIIADDAIEIFAGGARGILTMFGLLPAKLTAGVSARSARVGNAVL